MSVSDDHALLMQISYDLKRLETQGKQAEGITDKHLSAMERRAKKAAHEIEESLSLKNVNLGHALNTALLGAKEKVAEEGAAQIGVLGGALGALGGAGLIAAGGLAAFGLALERSKETAEWAETLVRASGALGLTTTKLQEFDFVAKSTGIPVEKMRESMAGLEKTIGLVESGLARSMSVKAFTDGLKITPEQLRGWGTLEQQLPHIVDAASKLNVEERAGLASRLKIDPEVLNTLVEEKDKIAELIATAHEYGIVMTHEMIEKSAQAAEKMHLAAGIIHGELNVAFAGLAPVAASAAMKMADAVTAVTDIARGARDALAPIGELIGKLNSIPFLKAQGGLGGIFVQGAMNMLPQPVQMAMHAVGQMREQGERDRKNLDLKEGIYDLLNPLKTPPATKLSSGTAKKAKSAGEPAGVADLDQADKLLAEAEKALAITFDDRAKFEGQVLDAEEKKAADKLAADLKKSKTPADRANIEAAQAETTRAFALKRELAARQLAQLKLDQAGALDTLRLQGEQDQLKAEQGLGVTTQRRGEIAKRLFALDEQIEEDRLAQVIASQTATIAEKERARLQLLTLRSTLDARGGKVSADASIAEASHADDLRQQALQLQIDQLTAEQGVYQTTERRREIALKLFALDEQIQEDKLREQIAEAKLAGDAEKQASLQRQLEGLKSTAGLRQASVDQANPADAWSAWVQDARQAAGDVRNAFAQAKVDGVEAFNDALFTTEGKLNSIGSIARSVARSFITDFEKFGVKSFEAGLFGGGQGGGGNPIAGAGSMLAGLFGGGKGGQGGAPGGGGIGGLLGGLFGKGGKDASGVTRPAGTAADPIFTSPAGGGAGGAGGGLSGILGSLTGGAGGVGGGDLMSSIMSMSMGFAGGGSFTVGGRGGIDKNLAMLRLSSGETVDIRTPQQQRDAMAGGIGGVNQTFVFPGANPDGFRRTRKSWSRAAKLAMQH